MPITQQYWRLFITGSNGTGVLALVNQWNFYDANNNPISTSGGTFTASSSIDASHLPANAFDNGVTTTWASAAAPSVGSPQWLQVQFPTAGPVVSVSIQITNDINAWPNQSPNSFLIQSSPDGTTWTTQNTIVSFPWNSVAQIAFFTASTVVGNARASRMSVEVIQKGINNVRVSEISVETLINPVAHVKASQISVEAVMNARPHAKISQVAVEIMFPYVASVAVPIQNFLLP